MKALLPLLLCSLAISGLSFAEHKHSRQIPYQKPGAPVTILSPEFIQMDPHTEESVIIELATPEAGTLTLSPKAPDNITIDLADNEISYNLAGRETTEIELNLASTEAGRYNLMFHATYDNAGQKSFRVFGVAVYVGEQQSTSQKTKAYPKHIIMPAKETIRTTAN